MQNKAIKSNMFHKNILKESQWEEQQVVPQCTAVPHICKFHTSKYLSKLTALKHNQSRKFTHTLCHYKHSYTVSYHLNTWHLYRTICPPCSDYHTFVCHVQYTQWQGKDFFPPHTSLILFENLLVPPGKCHIIPSLYKPSPTKSSYGNRRQPPEHYLSSLQEHHRKKTAIQSFKMTYSVGTLPSFVDIKLNHTISMGISHRRHTTTPICLELWICQQ